MSFRSYAPYVALALAVAALVSSVFTAERVPKVSAERGVMNEYGKTVEAQVAVTELAWGVASCADRAGALPATSVKVPADLSRVKGMTYQGGAPADWTDPAFVCARFHMLRPQHYRYQWERTSDTEGIVIADADLDGDGKPDHEVKLRVRCDTQAGALRCRPDPMSTSPSPLQVP